MNRAAVLGSPIAHSLSPALHRAGYVALGLSDWSYDAFRVEAVELAGFVAGLGSEWRGLSLTMPLKEAAFGVAAEASDLAGRAGAANTLVRRPDGRWRADNTDVAGIVEALRPHWPVSCSRASVLGAGATARSALLALAELGVSRVSVHARDKAKAAALVSWAMSAGVGITAGEPGTLDGWGTTAGAVVVSTLPPAAEPAQGLGTRTGGLLLDVVYADWPTPLARAAEEAGLTVVGGLEMLVHQAARQFELFTGRSAPVAVMLAAGREALARSPR